jgi:Family of unknown function (DUF6503)
MILMKIKSVQNTILLVIPVLILMGSCGINQPSGNEIMDKAFARHGGEYLKNLEIDFKFRNFKYEAKIVDGEFAFQQRTPVGYSNVSEGDEKRRFAQSDAKSVFHFALLPYNVNDKLAHKELMCTSKIKGEDYYKVEVTFDTNGGGDDFEDVYIYWVHKENFTIDYLAYSFYINGGGVRFREAYNQREVNGVRFQDYINYTIDEDYPAQELDYAFQTGLLREISRIDLDDIEVVRK